VEVYLLMPMACPICQFTVADLRGLAAHFRHQAATHPDYTTWADDRKWEGKTENEEFVRCRECGFRSESLARHLKSAHGMTADEYRAKHGRDALVRNLRTEERRREGIKSAGQDRTGTKVVLCPECEAPVEVHKHAGSLHDFRCSACKALSEEAVQEGKWEGKVEGVDFVTCLDCGYRGVSLVSHFQNAHPDYRERHPTALVNAEVSGSHIGGSVRKVNLTVDDLRPFMDTKGRVEVAKAADHLGYSWLTVLRYCRELNLPTLNRLASQKRVLDLCADILGEPYAWEWSHPEVRNPVTGHRLYYDGYFAKHNLVVEFHGKQHWEFVPKWHKTEEEFHARLAVDAHKEASLLRLGVNFVVVRENDPYKEPLFLRGLLARVLRPNPPTKTPPTDPR
jgi:ROS/MUCR transcriptional regulator protein